MNHEQVGTQDVPGAGVVANPSLIETMEAPYFLADVECVGADGKVKWTERVRNTVMTPGKTLALNILFGATAKVSTWYCGLISSVSYSAIAATDTAAQINGTNGWKEGATANAPKYTSPAARPALTFAAASGTAIATSAASSFTISADGTAKGMFCISDSTKDGTSGTLYSAGLFSADRVLIAGDTLNVTLTQNLT